MPSFLSVSRRDALALGAVVVLTGAIAPSAGFYTHFGARGVLTAPVLAVAACSLPERTWTVAPDFGERTLRGALLLLVLLAAWQAIEARDALAACLALTGGGLFALLRRGAIRPPAVPFLACVTAALMLFA